MSQKLPRFNVRISLPQQDSAACCSHSNVTEGFETMVRLRPPQRRMVVDKVPDLANIGAGLLDRKSVV